MMVNGIKNYGKGIRTDSSTIVDTNSFKTSHISFWTCI
jgi:hypothetical protein